MNRERGEKEGGTNLGNVTAWWRIPTISEEKKNYARTDPALRMPVAQRESLEKFLRFLPGGSEAEVGNNLPLLLPLRVDDDDGLCGGQLGNDLLDIPQILSHRKDERNDLLFMRLCVERNGGGGSPGRIFSKMLRKFWASRRACLCYEVKKVEVTTI